MSAAGDPLEEFPEGNSLRRLKGAFVVPRWLYAPGNIWHGRWLFLKPPAQTAMASAPHSSSVILLCADAQIQSASGSRDALLAATLVPSATADFMCKECVTVLVEENPIGPLRKSDASIPRTRNNGER